MSKKQGFTIKKKETNRAASETPLNNQPANPTPSPISQNAQNVSFQQSNMKSKNQSQPNQIKSPPVFNPLLVSQPVYLPTQTEIVSSLLPKDGPVDTKKCAQNEQTPDWENEKYQSSLIFKQQPPYEPITLDQPQQVSQYNTNQARAERPLEAQTRQPGINSKPQNQHPVKQQEPPYIQLKRPPAPPPSFIYSMQGSKIINQQNAPPLESNINSTMQSQIIEQDASRPPAPPVQMQEPNNQPHLLGTPINIKPKIQEQSKQGQSQSVNESIKSENPPKGPSIVFNPKWYQNQFPWQYESFPLETKIFLNHLQSLYSDRPVYLADAPKTDKVSVSQAKPLQQFINQFTNPQIKSRLAAKKQDFPTYRSIRGDGNCFYRAFIAGYLEMALTYHSPIFFLKLLFEFSKLKNLVQSDCQEYQYKELYTKQRAHFLMHRLLQLLSYRLEVNNDKNCRRLITQFLYRCFQQTPFQFDTYIVIAIKNYTASAVNLDPELLESSMVRNSIEEIRKWREECSNNEICIGALSTRLEINVTLFDSQKDRIDQRSYPPDSNLDAPEICVFFRPGHYDLIYRRKFAQGIYV